MSEVNEKILSTTFYFINFQLLEFVGFLVDLNNFISALFLVQALSVVTKLVTSRNTMVSFINFFYIVLTSESLQ